jgi:crotonobetainyl-CoA:carnitine CoA-transferase CaiB-like acyl-CoA transferase
MVLQGITVIDLTGLLPGPLATRILGDFGAEVIKVEGPGGELGRLVGPRVRSEPGPFLVLNTNKKSICLNLKEEKGRRIFLRLAAGADIILETFRPGVVDRLGIGYKDIESINPRIIYCSLSGFGQDGPWRERPNHDINYLALTGLLDIMGAGGANPIVPASQIGDITGSLLSVVGILLALHERERTGKGQFVDVAMMDATLLALSVYFGDYLATGVPPGRGRELLNGGYACYNVYETKDGLFMSLGSVEPHFWAAFCRLVNKEELIARQFSDPAPQSAMIGEIARVFRNKTQDEWVRLTKDENFPCEPVLSLDKAVTHPQVLSRRMVTEIDHPTEGRINQLGVAIKLSASPGALARPAPLLGEHTREILGRLGYSPDEIALFYKEGVIQ